MTAGAENHPLFRAAAQVARAAAAYHRADFVDAHHLPAGPALLVGNHGLFGWESVAFFYLLYKTTGRAAVGMTDRLLFGGPAMRRILEPLGGVPGTRQNALEALADKRLVVCYPGGSRETFKARAARYQLAWDRSDGFARLACDAGVQVVPFAGLGVDDTFVNFGHAAALRARFGRYAMPFAIGLGPLPLPVRIRFAFGAPIQPYTDPGRLKRLVQGAVESLLEDHGQAARAPAAALP